MNVHVISEVQLRSLSMLPLRFPHDRCCMSRPGYSPVNELNRYRDFPTRMRPPLFSKQEEIYRFIRQILP